MPGHQEFNGIPMHMYGAMINGMLRDDWSFDGFIVSDNNDVSRLQIMHRRLCRCWMDGRSSANGYIFSLFNKDCEIGIRFSKEKQQEYIDNFNTSYYLPTAPPCSATSSFRKKYGRT